MNPARNCVSLKKTILLSKAFSGNLKNKTFFLQGKKISEFNPCRQSFAFSDEIPPLQIRKWQLFPTGKQLHLSRMPSGRGVSKGLLRLLQKTVWSCSSALHPTGSLTLGSLRLMGGEARELFPL